MKVILKNTRLAFPVVWEPTAKKPTDKPACSAAFIFNQEKDPANYKLMVDTIKKVATDKWGARAADILKTIKAKGDMCLHDGAEKAEYAGFEGNVYVSARNNARPQVFDRRKQPLTERDGVIYAGCVVNGVLDVWAQDSKEYGKRINAKLLIVQFVEDAEAFGGGEQGSIDDIENLDEGHEPVTTEGDPFGDDDIPF